MISENITDCSCHKMTFLIVLLFKKNENHPSQFMFSSSFYSFCILFFTLHTNYYYSLIFIQPQLSTRKKCFNFQLTNIAVYIIRNHISNYNYWTLMDGIARFYVDLSYFFLQQSLTTLTQQTMVKSNTANMYSSYNRQCLFLQQFSTNCCKNSRESYSYNK